MVIPCIEDFGLYRTHALTIALRKVKLFNVAEDMAQDACLALLQARERWERILDVLPWLAGHVRNAAARYWRRQRDEPISLEFDAADVEVVMTAGHRRPLARLRKILEAYESTFRPWLTRFQYGGYDSMLHNRAWAGSKDENHHRVGIAKKILRISEILTAAAHLTDGDGCSAESNDTVDDST